MKMKSKTGFVAMYIWKLIRPILTAPVPKFPNEITCMTIEKEKKAG